MNDNRILFVDLDGTLIKEDLSNLAFISCLKKYPFRLIYYLIIFLIKGKPYLKEKISSNFKVPISKLTFESRALEIFEFFNIGDSSSDRNINKGASAR